MELPELGDPPIALFYSRLHDCIRDELTDIAEHVVQIDSAAEGERPQAVDAIHARLKFLAQVYNYHSVAEDEIMYPALDSKVKNVTVQYRVEHADEGHLFVQLMQLLMHLPSNDQSLVGSLRALTCKVEEVSTTIRKHLAKEEEQLFPLLLEHFSYSEQASMIAQFLFCIPMTTVQSFVEWIQPSMEREERRRLVQYMRDTISDNLLMSLLTEWLVPSEAVTSKRRSDVERWWSVLDDDRCPPLRQLVKVHRSIDRALESFISEARQLLERNFAGGSFSSLHKKHRFLKEICRFHMMSEEEVVFPELHRRDSEASSDVCRAEHVDEGVWFDDLGRLLTDVRSTARRGADEAKELMEQVVTCAESMRKNLAAHMTREEEEVFPLLQAKLDRDEQCLILWQSIKMMPLRLLEEVMPWISCHLDEREREAWTASLRIGGMEDSMVVEWALSQSGESDDGTVSCTEGEEGEIHPTKRLKTNPAPHTSRQGATSNPVDHIFQFHRALRRDFRLFETEIQEFVKSMEAGEKAEWKDEVQELKGRFAFLWGLYQAHSKTEDDVMFPELESKEATRNVSHSYMIDHRQEEKLFSDIQEMLGALMSCDSWPEVHDLALKLSRKCAAVRSSLETHIRAEETELWPLFIEHFSMEEQQRIIGLVIGRTGAEVLQMMLPWVSSCFTEQEKNAMMDSWHEATKNTRFNKWMQNWNPAQESPSSQVHAQETTPESLHDVVEYLRSRGLMDDSSQAGDFSLSFEDMFRLNQSQLEAAVRHVSSDQSLEPQRKSYLIQRILVSKYITSHHTQSRKAASAEHQGHFQRYHSKEEGILGCMHYQRKVALVAPCCDEIYVCRLCHDAEQDHKLDRYAVQEIVCMECNTRQLVARNCSACGVLFARYHCSICRLYDDQPDKDIYHCPFCNVCRRGKGLGIDFFHCMECNACMHTSMQNNHHCREKCIEVDCAICHESIFDSSMPIKELRCGHFLHASCFARYSKWNYRCPVCLKSFGDMSAYFRMLDSFRAADPMPLEFQSVRQSILCHDCGKTSEVPFHFVYHCCRHCHSYNTRLL